MVEDIEELTLDAQVHMLGQGKHLRQIEITPNKIRTSQSIAPQGSELAIPCVVAANAGTRTWVNGGDKSVWVEPLNVALLRNPGDGIVVVRRNARNRARELRSSSLHDASSIRRIGCAEYGKWNACVPEEGP